MENEIERSMIPEEDEIKDFLTPEEEESAILVGGVTDFEELPPVDTDNPHGLTEMELRADREAEASRPPTSSANKPPSKFNKNHRGR